MSFAWAFCKILVGLMDIDPHTSSKSVKIQCIINRKYACMPQTAHDSDIFVTCYLLSCQWIWSDFNPHPLQKAGGGGAQITFTNDF